MASYSRGETTTTPEFRTITEVLPASTHVAIQGELDIYTAPALRDLLQNVISEGAQDLLLDLTDMAFIDSTGLGVIVGALKRVRERGGNLVLRAPTPAVRKVLDITGLSEIIRIEDHVGDPEGVRSG
jgi:anti-sigma B factor antagonist